MLEKTYKKFKGLSANKKLAISVTGVILLLVATSYAFPVKVEDREETRIESVPFETEYIKNNSLEKGKTLIKIAGQNGKKEVLYRVTYVNDKEDSKKVIKEQVLAEPKKQISYIGTREVLPEEKTQAIPFSNKTVYDSNLPKGQSRIRTEGVEGLKKITYLVTKIDGKEISRKITNVTVIKNPITQVTAIGTRNCDPNYSGACVPIAYDVDCAGGSGNGPAYVDGPVYVIGWDIYDLDRDGDGTGCEW